MLARGALSLGVKPGEHQAAQLGAPRLLVAVAEEVARVAAALPVYDKRLGGWLLGEILRQRSQRSEVVEQVSLIDRDHARELAPTSG